MPKVSVIVPVYNTEKYLSRCIDSILTQTFTNFELILVNDGSSDKSGIICDNYAQRDSRIIVIHKVNGGANKAREYGVKIARGEWITFVDSDDTIKSNYIEILFSNISNDIDIIIAKIDKIDYNFNGIISCEKYRSYLIRGRFPNPVCRLYRSRLFDRKTFEIPSQIIMGEDLLMNIRIAFNTNKKIKVINSVIYSYNINPESTSNTYISSIDYDDNFFKELISSIPYELSNSYNGDIFYHVYNLWSNYCGYKYAINQKWEKTNLNVFLINNYRNNINILNKFDFELIESKNLLVRFILITLKKIINRIN